MVMQNMGITTIQEARRGLRDAPDAGPKRKFYAVAVLTRLGHDPQILKTESCADLDYKLRKEGEIQ